MTNYKNISIVLGIIVVILLAMLVMRSNADQQAAALRGTPQTNSRVVVQPDNNKPYAATNPVTAAGMSLTINGVPIGGTSIANYTYAGSVTAGALNNMTFTYSVPNTYSGCTTFAGDNGNPGSPGTSGWNAVVPVIGMTTTYLGTEMNMGQRIIYGLSCTLTASGQIDSLYGAVEVL